MFKSYKIPNCKEKKYCKFSLCLLLLSYFDTYLHDSILFFDIENKTIK